MFSWQSQIKRGVQGMTIIKLLMLLAPGLVSLRIVWRGKRIGRQDYKYIVCDYVIYMFAIQTIAYAFMFFSYPDRLVSFSTTNIWATSHILSASFVFKYSAISIFAAVVLPVIVVSIKGFFNRIDDRKSEK